MESNQDIRALLRNFLDNQQIIIGKVSEVDEHERTCTIYDGVDIPGVRLQPVTGSAYGILSIPAVDSTALAVKLDTTDEFVLLQATKLEKHLITMNNISMVIENDQITFNEGTTGMVKLDVLLKKINALENTLNSILIALKGVSIPLAPTGDVPFLPFFENINSITPTLQADLEDIKLKH